MHESETRTEADVVVIGAGSAGMVAYRAARAQGKRVLLVEGGAYGTTCARVGCMPSKLLIAAADAAHAVRHAQGFGVHGGEPRVDGAAVLQRVRAERDRFVSFVLDEVQQIPAEDRITGHARFVAPGEVEVDGRKIVARAFVIATGSHPNLPPLLLQAGPHLLTSDSLFELPALPRSVAVVGTGSIGLELGQALHRLGVRTVLFGRSETLGPLGDPQVLAAARAALGKELDLRLQHTLLQLRADAHGVQLRSRAPTGEERSEEFDAVLAATGRAPDLAGLDLARAGVALDARGVPLFNPYTMQCGTSPVFVAGDASGERELLHEAADTGRIAGENAARFPQVQPGLRRSPLAITFTAPQIATVGIPYSELPSDAACGAVSFENQGRSRVMLENSGLLRLYADRNDNRLLGAELCGPRAEHLAHLLAWSHQQGLTIDAMLEMPFYHPVVEEGLRTALRDVRKALKGGLPARERCTQSTPGV